MLPILAPLPAAILAYLLGRALLPLLLEGKTPIRHRLLLELLGGILALSCTGLLLAEVGWFGLGALVLASLAGITAARWGRSGGPPPYTPADWGGLALATALFATLQPPFQSILYGIDASAYAASGIHIAETGSLVIHDPTILELPPATRTAFFTPYTERWDGPPFVRVFGGLLLPSLDTDRVLSAFHPLLSIWLAIHYAIGGDGGLFQALPFFASLAAWAIGAFALDLGGRLLSVFALTFLLIQLPQYWYARFSMPEIPTQLLLWGGLLAAAASERADQPRLGFLAGASLGVAGLMRLDSLLHLVAALALWKVFTPPASWPARTGGPFLCGLAIAGAWIGAHQLLFPTHYVAEISYFLQRSFASLSPGAMLLAGIASSAVAFLLLRRKGNALRGRSVPVQAAAAFVFLVYAATAFRFISGEFDVPLAWLRTYAGLPLLLAAAPGAVIWFARSRTRTERFAIVLCVLVTVQLICNPNVSPAPLWGIRRFLPFSLPFIALAAAGLTETLYRRVHPLLGTALAAALAVVPLTHLVEAAGEPAYRNTAAHVRAIGALLAPRSVVIGPAELLVHSHLHLALWATQKTPVYLTESKVSEKIRLLLDALPDRRIYWVGSAHEPPEASQDYEALPLGTYEFTLGNRIMLLEDERDDFFLRKVRVGIYEILPTKRKGRG